MRRGLIVLSLFVLGLGHAAIAKVLHSGPNGFAVSHEATVKLAPAEAYAAFLNIGAWWDKSHTFSGDPKNITIDTKPGGCWCEAMPNNGFVKHMEVGSAVPGERLVFHGGLGPLHFMGATGAMTVKFMAAEGGTRVTLLYQVAGYDPDGFVKLGPAVDGVLGAQLASYAGRSPR
jgi:uncharacterized protein YndB with AHSA1/START domain